MVEKAKIASRGAAPRTPAIESRLARIAAGSPLQNRKASSDYIADALRAAIYDGQFEDGEELNQVELARHFGVSRIPIRESLRRLQAEGLISSIAHRRAVVIALGVDEIVEQIEMRAVLEAYLVEQAAPNIPRSEFQQLYRLCDAMDRMRSYGSGWVERNWAFHRAVYEFAERPAAIATVEQMQLRVERYVRRAGRKDRLRTAAAEHRQIVAALEVGDVIHAAGLMRQHILHTGLEVRRYFGSHEAGAVSELNRDSAA